MGDTKVMTQAEARNLPWVTTSQRVNSNNSGWMLYKPDSAAHTFPVDLKTMPHWQCLGAKAGSDPLYYSTGDAKLNRVIEACMPFFVHDKTRARDGGRGDGSQVAMSLNGLSVEDAWTHITFFGISMQGTNAFAQGDRPIISGIRSSKFTLRNTGPCDIDTGDLIVYVPPEMLLIERYMESADAMTFVPTRKEDNGLFRLMPMPLHKAVDYVLRVDAALRERKMKGILGGGSGHGGKKPSSTDVDKDDKKAKSKDDTQEDELIDRLATDEGRKEWLGKLVAYLTEQTQKREREQRGGGSSSSLSSSSSSSSVSSTSPAEQPWDIITKTTKYLSHALNALGGHAAPGGEGGPAIDAEPVDRRKRAMQLLMTRFFAGRALQPGLQQANYVLEVHGSQFG